jgi:hypothetical protein
MEVGYNPKGYEKDRSIIEKIIFSAPEYFVFETRLGMWIAMQLQKILSSINRYSISNIPKTEDSYLRKIFETLTDFIFKSLNWMNYFFERKKREEET